MNSNKWKVNLQVPIEMMIRVEPDFSESTIRVSVIERPLELRKPPFDKIFSSAFLEFESTDRDVSSVLDGLKSPDRDVQRRCANCESYSSKGTEEPTGICSKKHFRMIPTSPVGSDVVAASDVCRDHAFDPGLYADG